MTGRVTGRFRELGAAAVVVAAAAIVVTWPQAARLGTAVNDFGDPLLNSWTLAWVAHALTSQPLHLFDANIFHPELATLAYSESLILPGLMVSPLLWAGADPILAHNILVLAGYAGSGLAMFVLVRSLTGQSGAALVAAVAFTVYPYRIESYGRMQIQLVWWMPLSLWAVHCAARMPTIRHGVLAGIFVAAQVYSCLYYGVFALIPLAIISAASVLTAPSRGRTLRALGIGAVVTSVLIMPLAAPYRTAARVVGERSVEEVRHFSAELADFRRAPADSALYGDVDHPGPPERSLFPGYLLPIVAAGALVPPVSVAAVTYAAAAFVSADLALGTNGWGYQALYNFLPPFRAVRVPARFAMVLGLALSVLAGLGAARLLRGRSPLQQITFAAVLIVAIVFEARPRFFDLSALPDREPAVYAWLAAQPDGVVCEFPVGPLGGRTGPQDPTYMYYSTRHWKPLINGYSGFAPPSYRELLDRLRTFPSDEAIAYLRARRVTYLLVHSPFYVQGDFDADVRALESRDDVTPAGRFPWKGGGVTRVFRVRP